VSAPGPIPTLAFLDIGFGEMVVVAFVALLMFGGKLPDVMRKFGASYREFRRGLEDVARDPTARRAPPHASTPYHGAPQAPDAGLPSVPPMPPPTPDPAFAQPPLPGAPPAAAEPLPPAPPVGPVTSRDEDPPLV
jgi:TatA/E family protein of Tat protein translocase